MTKNTLPNTKPIMCKIIEKIENCEDTFVFLLDLPVNVQGAKPGQFIMLWVPGIDEFPVGVAGFDNNILEIGVAKMGPGTEALLKMDVGEFLGIRGFYGKSFQPPKNMKVNHLLIGGGFGMTPIKMLTTSLLKKEEKEEIHIFEGARNKSRLMYLEWFQKLHDENKLVFHVCTDDGSYGYQGFPTLDLEMFLQETKTPSVLYVAGPERMMKAIFEIGKKYENVIDMQMSLADRYMRCGFGVCSYCAVDPTGWRICVDGPVFNMKQLEQISDFGTYRRLDTGEKQRI
ncbi:MAG: dihydroorotate dehydrogenase electron transfer subunit [Candidatus Heimdallarchaeota archaeon]|nr:dihydroorotate dehydrogenase electron transfer subunit [Candidatus Heimdallarchaeota archaeon]